MKPPLRFLDACTGAKETDVIEAKMQQKKNIGINAILNVIKQGLGVFFPLITYPYALRVLGVVNTGKVNYATSIISYFSLIAALGITSYAVREGAKRKENRTEFQEFACEVFTINVFSTLLSYVMLFIAILLIQKLRSYSVLLYILSISIALTTLGVDWINMIYEDFFLITMRSIVTHIISLVLLFLFVHEPSDLYQYAFLSVITNGIICISNWIHCRKYVKFKLKIGPELSRHLRPLLILFANSVAISIYVSMDTTMLGWIKGDYNVGIYSAAVKIYNIIKSIMAAIYIVAIPRLSYYRGNEEPEQYRKLCTDLWGYLSILLIPAGVGLIAISDEIIYFMGGTEYQEASQCLRILGLSLIFAIFGGLVTACMNITLGREKENMIATIISAIGNCVLNLLFIPLFSQNGAAFTTLLSEAFVFIFCFVKLPHKDLYLDGPKITRTIVHSAMGAIIILVVSFSFKRIIPNDIARIAAIVLSSSVAYAAILLLLKDEYFCYALQVIKKKMAA